MEWIIIYNRKIRKTKIISFSPFYSISLANSSSVQFIIMLL